MERIQPNLSSYFELPNPNLRGFLQRTVNGNTEDYRPPFWKGRSRESVLKDWQSILDRLGVEKQYPGLYEYEMEMKGKVGPMSIQLPLSQRIESIEAYYTRAEIGDSEPIPEEAILDVLREFRSVKGIRQKSFVNTVQDMRLSTNSGNPWYQKRRKVVESALQSTMWKDTNGKFMCRVDGKVYELAAVLGWRGQEGGIDDSDVKQRVIFMMSFLLNIYELSYYQPLISAIQRYNLIPAYVSMDAVDDRVTKLFATKRPEDVVICTDFTKFDQSFNPRMQDASRQILQGLFTPNSSSQWWFDNVYEAKYNIPLICSDEIAYIGPHGMGSGSGGTNADESLAHRALQYDACRSAKTQLNINSMAYGDDGIITAPGLTVEHVIQSYTSHGMEMNPDKQYESTHDCVVLRRWHSTEYTIEGKMVGVYPTFRALGRLLAQERYYDPEVWSADMVTLRAWSILENCKYSPYFEEFVQFVMKGDKYRLGLDLEGFFNRIDKIIKDSRTVLPDFLGYTKTMQLGESEKSDAGIRQWRIYNYLKSLR